MIPTLKLRWFPKGNRDELARQKALSRDSKTCYGVLHSAYPEGDDELFVLQQWWEDIESGKGEWRDINIEWAIDNENEFEVWTEGFCATGESGTATFRGRFKGATFKDAVIAYKNTIKDEHTKSLIDIDRMTFWGCRFYDNEKDARRTFG